MKGQILDYSVQSNTGTVSGGDGNRYQFSGAEWKGTNVPSRGMSVAFEADGNQAKSVYNSFHMRKRNLIVGLFTALCTLTGCLATGSKGILSKSVVQQIQEGKTTKDQVRQIMGKAIPRVDISPDGKEQWFYFHFVLKVAGKNETAALVILYDEKGVVSKVNHVKIAL